MGGSKKGKKSGGSLEEEHPENPEKGGEVSPETHAGTGGEDKPPTNEEMGGENAAPKPNLFKRVFGFGGSKKKSKKDKKNKTEKIKKGGKVLETANGTPYFHQ